MSEYSLLVTDIDGTLLPGGRRREGFYNFPAQSAISRANACGKAVSLATGRPLEWTTPIADTFGITAPIIVNNGARVSDPTSGRTLWEQQLPEGAGEQIQAFLGELASSRDVSVRHENGQAGVISAVTLGMMQETVYLDLIGISDPADSLAIAGFIAELDDTSCVVVSSPQLPGGHNILVTHAEGTKFHGVRALQALLGVLPEQTIAAGNDVNDTPLLAAAGLSAAVADADPRLLAVADVIIPPAHEYGLAQLIYSELIPA